jgi:hypothetical protein
MGNVAGDSTSALFMLVFIAVGFYVSWASLSSVTVRRVKDVLLVVVALVALVRLFSSPETVDTIMTSTTGTRIGGEDMADLLSWLVLVCSFHLVSPKTLLFLCVPLLSMMGLLVSVGGDAGTMIYFILFLGLACLMLILENWNTASGYDRGRAQTRFSRRVALAAGITVISLALGWIVGLTVNSKLGRLPRGYGMASLIPQTDSVYPQVGSGPANSSDKELFCVTASTARLWRGQVYNEYNGHGWRMTLGDSENRLQSELAPASPYMYQTSVPPESVSESRPSTQEFEQTIKVTSGPLLAVYAAPEIRTIITDRRMEFISFGGMVTSRRWYSAGAVLKVISQVSVAGSAELRDAGTRYPSAIREGYLDTPESCWKVRPLTNQIVKGKKNPYDKAAAIRDYLAGHFTYDLNAPATPHLDDPVTYFLFESKRGYCDVFSTAMVVMCRQAGIPARWATGFAPGQYSDKDRSFHVQAKDSHAWAEVYFPKYGWIEFDPTPGGEGESWKKRALDRLNTLEVMLGVNLPRVLLYAIIVLLAAYLLKTEVLDRFIRRNRARHGVNVRPSPAVETYRRMCVLLSKFGFPRHPDVTASEYASSLDTGFTGELSHLAEAAKILTSDFEEARYSERQVPPERIEKGIATLEHLKQGLRDAKKRHQIMGKRARE